MTHINYNLKVRRKNMRCTKAECDMAKAFAGAFKNVIEDNKRMKDALISFQALFSRNDTFPVLLDCNDNGLSELINSVYIGIRKLKEKGNDKSE